jgi:competence protein ComEA
LAGSQFARPVARAALVATALVVLACIGRSTVAGAGAGPSASATAVTAPAPLAPPVAAAPEVAAVPPRPEQAASTPAAAAPTFHAGTASPDDPVTLNTATVDDLRRLPGVGPKRAEAILALRSRLGRFRAVDDLLKVKGIGRATLRRLRPMVRLDAPGGGPSLLRDAGVGAITGPGPPSSLG